MAWPILVLAAVIAGVLYWLHVRSFESTDDAFVDGTITSVSTRIPGHVARVLVKDNQYVKAGDVLVELDPADYQARRDGAKAVLDSAQAAEKARKINVEITDAATRADEDEAAAGVTAAKARVALAEAQAAAAKARLDQATAHKSFVQAALAEAQAAVDSAEAASQRDASDWLRYQNLAKTGSVTDQDLEHARTRNVMSTASLEAARMKVQTQEALVAESDAALSAAEKGLIQARAEVSARQAAQTQAEAKLAKAQSGPKHVNMDRMLADQSTAGVEQAAADLQQAELSLSYTKILAPCDGYVTKKGVEPGAYIQPGKVLLFLVAEDVWITANFKETQITRMRAGQPVKIRVDAYPDVTLHGTVQSIQRGTGSRFSLLPPENATGNFVKVVQRVPLKIVLDPDDRHIHETPLVPGLSVTPIIDVSAPGKALDTSEPGKS